MEREKVPIIKHMLWLLPATWSQLRTLGMVFMHSFRKRETVNYPEQQVYLPPRYRGRIVLTAIRTAKSVAWPATCVR